MEEQPIDKAIIINTYLVQKFMNHGIDRVKNTKRILKEMKVIEVMQKRKYYYVHLFFIYTKKKIGEIFGTTTESLKALETEDLSLKEVKKEGEARLKPSVPSVPNIFTKWIKYCDKNSIRYSKNNLNYWQKKLENRTTIEQKEAIYTAISKKWKNFSHVTPT